MVIVVWPAEDCVDLAWEGFLLGGLPVAVRWRGVVAAAFFGAEDAAKAGFVASSESGSSGGLAAVAELA
jgi:hypothetical protein